MDPHAVLGLAPDAHDDEITRAFRELALRFHPDRAGEEGARRMAEINAAYDMLKRDLAQQVAEHARRAAPRPRVPGAWLSPVQRRQVGAEILKVLEPQEAVLLVADAATWDSPSVRLVATDRRLVWLRDDAPIGRVRSLRYGAIERAEARRRGRRAELRLHPRDQRRISFAALAPDVLDSILRILARRLAAAR